MRGWAPLFSDRASKPASRMCILRPLTSSTKRERMPGGGTDWGRGASPVIFSSPPHPALSPQGGEGRVRGVGQRSARVLDGLSEKPGALVVALGRLPAIGEAYEFLAAAIDEERRPRRVLDAVLHRRFADLGRLGPRGQLDPDEEAALGLADLHVGTLEHFPEALEHRVALGAVDVYEPRHVGHEVVAH